MLVLTLLRKSSLAAAIVVALSHCVGPAGNEGPGGKDGTNGSNGLKALVNVAIEPAGTRCPTGGNRVDSGVDVNANGTLESTEVTVSQYVCNGANGTAGTNGAIGANGHSALVIMSAEGNGTNCPTGGSKIEVGADSNDNGALDASEITSTGYVCTGANGTNGTNGTNGANGTNGTVGANGRNSLLASAPEPVGTRCPNGGTRITSGIDANDNNILDSTEVSATSYLCNGPGVNWVNVTASAAVQATSNTGYIANNPSSQVTFTLPATPVIGDIVRIKGASTQGFVIAQNAGQYINLTGVTAWSSLSGRSWSQVKDTSSVWEITLKTSSNGQTVASLNSWTNQVLISKNAGATWVPGGPIVDSNLGGITISPDGTRMYVRSFIGANGFYVSTDTGGSFVPRTTMTSVLAFAAFNGGIVAIGTVALVTGVFISTDDGTTWTPLTLPSVPATPCWASVSTSYDGKRIGVGGDGNGSCSGIAVYTSNDTGATWVMSPSAGGPYQNRNQQVAVSPSGNLVVVTSGNAGVPVFVSSDGSSWSTTIGTQVPSGQPAAVSADGRRIAIVDALTNNIHVSNNRGATFTSYDSGHRSVNVTGSADLSILYSGNPRNLGGLVYKSVSTPSVLNLSTVGTSGWVSGGSSTAVELQYVGGGQWGLLSAVGNDFIIQ